jgi:hypothetical protein
MTIAFATVLLAVLGLAAMMTGYAGRTTRLGPCVMGFGIVLLLAAVVHHVVKTLG